MNSKSKNYSNVTNLNKSITEYQSSINLYKKFPTMPTFCKLLEKSLIANIKTEDLELELNLLFNISNEQFFCCRGSKELKEKLNLLHKENISHPDSMSSVETSKILWKIFESYKGDEIYGYENYLVGDSDYSYLTAKDYINEAELIAPTVRDRSVIAEFAYNAASAFIEFENTAKSLHGEAEKLGFKMIPWSVWTADILESRSELNQGLLDFSNYLASYFEDENAEETGFSNKNKLNQDNKNALLRIVSFLLFSPLIKNTKNKFTFTNLDDFCVERLVNFSCLDVFSDLNNRVEYLIAISNYLMICAKFGISAVESGLVSEGELKREFLSGCESEYLDTACLAMLPPSGLGQIIPLINSFEGDRVDNFFFDDVLRVADYGIRGVPNKRLIDEMFKNGFVGLDDEITNLIRSKTEKNIKNWVIPFNEISYLHHVYDGFWDDDEILEKITDTLSYIDRDSEYQCKFSSKDINNTARHPDMYDSSHHPALFARRFSNKVDFLSFEDEEWLRFAKSLNTAGQKRFLCVLIALYFTSKGYIRFYNAKPDTKINIPEWVKLIQSVQFLNSFKLVQQSLADMHDLYGDFPVLFKGSIQEFLPNGRSEILSIDIKSGNRFTCYKNDLISMGLTLDKLVLECQNSLIKGYTLTRDKQLAVFELNSAALQNYFLAVEGELRSRLATFDDQLISELQHFNIDIDYVKQTNSKNRLRQIRGLHGIILLLESFTKFSESSRRKLIKIAPLAVHEDCDVFLNSLRKFKDIRNSVQHADQSAFSSVDLVKKVAIVEELLFEDGKIIDILCKTKKH